MDNKIERLYNLIKKFETDNNSKTTAVLFDNDNSKGWYRLMIASECLDELSPFDATLKVVKYLKENDPTIYPDIPFNITIFSLFFSVITLFTLNNISFPYK
mgnify:CR=1 FL=1